MKLTESQCRFQTPRATSASVRRHTSARASKTPSVCRGHSIRLTARRLANQGIDGRIYVSDDGGTREDETDCHRRSWP